MQHERNKSESPVEEILRYLFGENVIVEMIEDPGLGPQEALELVEILIAVKAEDAKVEVPLSVLRVVLDSAKRGMHEGRRREEGRPRKSYIEKVVRNLVVEW